MEADTFTCLQVARETVSQLGLWLSSPGDKSVKEVKVEDKACVRDLCLLRLFSISRGSSYFPSLIP